MEEIIYKDVTIDIYIGVPGVGKSTTAAYLASKALKKGRKVYSNFPISGCYLYNTNMLGKFRIKNSLVIVDEAGLYFDNRKMSMTDSQIKFVKKHRHDGNDVVFFSQGLDVDIKVRKVAQRYFLLKRSLFPWFVKRCTVDRTVGLDSEGQWIDKFIFRPWWLGGNYYFFAPPYWRMFDSWESEDLPDMRCELVPPLVPRREKIFFFLKKIAKRVKGSPR